MDLLGSGKNYVGSAIDLSKRLKCYFSSSELKRVDNYISKALLHHTHSAFSLTIFEYIDISSKSVKETCKLILEREQFYIDFLGGGPEYNILQKAGSSLDYKHSEEAIAKMSGEKNPMYGKIHNNEIKMKMSLVLSDKNHPIFGKKSFSRD